MKKFIFIKSDGFNDLIVIADEPNQEDNQNRMEIFKQFYDTSKIEKEGLLNLLDEECMSELKLKAMYFLSKEYRNSIIRSDKSNFKENYFSITKFFLNESYLLDGIDDRLAITCIDIYNINGHSKLTNNSILYMTANTKYEASILGL